MKVLIKTSLCFVFSGLLARIAFLKNSASFNSFAGDTIIQMIGTIFAINIGIVPILFYEINKIEKEIGEPGDFSSVKLVIRQNAVVMTALVIISLVIGVLKKMVPVWIEYGLSSVILGCVFLAVTMLYDIVSCVLALDSGTQK